jgi:hypothetical protein
VCYMRSPCPVYTHWKRTQTEQDFSSFQVHLSHSKVKKKNSLLSCLLFLKINFSWSLSFDTGHTIQLSTLSTLIFHAWLIVSLLFSDEYSLCDKQQKFSAVFTNMVPKV